MNEKKRKEIVKIVFIILILIILTLIFYTPKADATEDISKCIGQNSILYTQLGCGACIKQEQIFGEYYENLNIIDCFYEEEKCSEIEYTPTWIINEEKYVGVQEIEKLKQLTNCSK